MINKLISFSTYAALVVGAVPVLAFAQGAPALPSTNLTGPRQVLSFLCEIAGWIFAFLIVLAVIFILIAAFRYLTAQGNPESVSKANQSLIFAAVAVGVAIVAKAIPAIVSGFLGAGAITAC